MHQYDQLSRYELIKEIEALKRKNSLLLVTQSVALRESEARYRRMIETANEGIMVTDPKGAISFVNTKMALMLGYHPHEMVGRYIFDLMDEEWARLCQEKISHRRKVGKEQFEFCLQSKEGYQVWCHVAISPIYGDDEVFQGSFAMVTDITGRKKAEDALKTSEERYRAMVESLPGLSYICSADYRIEFINERFKRHIGRDATGELCYQALHELSEICPWCVNQRVAAGETVSWEVQSPKDGHWYHVTNSPIYNRDGTVSKHAIINDITAIKEMETELGARKSMLEQAELQGSFGSWQWEAASGSFTLSGQAAALLGSSSAVLAGDDFLALIQEGDRGQVETAIHEPVAPGKKLELLFRLVRPEAAEIPLRMQGEALLDPEQKPVGLCGILFRAG
ncbi:PAS domain S-box protein [Geomonas sp. Red32]|uniref:PAS domain-containing protein n=1 Tax=Geomonas sp. Red32 TaxID=2912856 RepID=UPI00202CD974|nr:PAS domain S-box protein [Geomonas sp. Red32]MCM0082478.1 PAS domain S-box protein [Geomonas sp. Red32]